MMSSRVGIGVMLAALAVFDGMGVAPQDAREAHGGFTGEVKPVLYVADAEASMPFFRDALGFEFLGYANLDGAPYYAELAAGPLKFGLHEPITPEQAQRIGQQRLYFRVEDLTAHRSRVAAWGGEPGVIVETGWMDFFIVGDVDGHEIVFAVTDPEKHGSNPWRVSTPAMGVSPNPDG